MNLHFTTYSEAKCKGTSNEEWQKFGAEQLELLLEYLKVPNSREFTEHIMPLTKLVKTTKNEVLIQYNDANPPMYYMLQGGVRIIPNNEETSQRLTLLSEGNVIFDNNYIATGDRAQITVETTQPSTLLKLNYGELQAVMIDSPRLIRRFDQAYLSFIIITLNFFTQHLQLHSLPNHSKVEYMRQHFTGIFDRFLMKDIAAFAGMDPASLSRLIAKQNDIKKEFVAEAQQ